MAKATGLSVHTIRAWEKRYQVTKPRRSESNRRLYNDADVERLTLMRKAIERGHNIGLIAHASIPDLQGIVNRVPGSTEPDAEYDPLERCIAAMNALDADALDREFNRSLLLIGADRFVSEIVLQLVSHLDMGWQNKTISIAQEHLVSALLGAQLNQIRNSMKVGPNSPRIILTTPSGQLHEIGALIAAFLAARHGWQVTYLGPNLPATEIAKAATDLYTTTIGLSLVYPLGHKSVVKELQALRALLPKTKILIGGRAADSYRDVIDEIGAISVVSPQDFQSILRSSAEV